MSPLLLLIFTISLDWLIGLHPYLLAKGSHRFRNLAFFILLLMNLRQIFTLYLIIISETEGSQIISGWMQRQPRRNYESDLQKILHIVSHRYYCTIVDLCLNVTTILCVEYIWYDTLRKIVYKSKTNLFQNILTLKFVVLFMKRGIWLYVYR